MLPQPNEIVFPTNLVRILGDTAHLHTALNDPAAVVLRAKLNTEVTRTGTETSDDDTNELIETRRKWYIIQERCENLRRAIYLSQRIDLLETAR